MADGSSPCPVTLPNGRVPALGAGVNHGNGRLYVSLWDSGRVVVGATDVNPDGSIEAKFGWWRKTGGRLRIFARRLDGEAAVAQTRIPSGYGRRGFQATSITFPATGCWQVTGTVGRRVRLTFVTLVVIE